MSPRPDADAITVWVVRHPSAAYFDERGLSADEVVRARRFSVAARRDAFVATRRALRRVLAASMGGDPERLEFAYSAEGRPALKADAAPKFSVTHARDLSLIAVGQNLDVGVDVEEKNQTLDFVGLAARFFPRAEAEAIAAAPAGDGLTAFLTAWTRKEAMAKAAGDGIAETLDTSVSCAGSAPISHRSRDGVMRDWFLHALDIGPAHVAALALSRPVERIDLADFVP